MNPNASESADVLAEAKAYIEKSLEDQIALGYSRPPEAVVERAVADAARAIRRLRVLS